MLDLGHLRLVLMNGEYGDGCGAEGDGNVVDGGCDESLFLIHRLNSVKSCRSVFKYSHRREEGSFDPRFNH